MKKRISFLLAALTALLLFASCGGYEVRLGIGDGSAADDAVTVSFTLPEKIKDGFTLSCRRFFRSSGVSSFKVLST